MIDTQNKEILLRDAHAESYDRELIKIRTIFGKVAEKNTVQAHLKPDKTESILDAGCGTGIHTIQTAKLAHDVMAVDFSSNSIDILNKKLKATQINNVSTKVGDIAIMELPSNRFDKAISIEVIQHIPTHQKRVLALKNIFNALKPNGKFVMIVYRYGGRIKYPKPKEELNHAGVGLYRFAFEEKDAQQIFTEVGFHVEFIGGVLNIHNKIRKRLPPWLSFVDVWISKLGISRKFGDLLLVVGRKPL